VPRYSDVSSVLESIDLALDDWTVSGDAMRMAPPRLDAIFSWDVRDGSNLERASATFNAVDLQSMAQLQPGERIWVDGIPRRITERLESCGLVCFILEEILPSTGEHGYNVNT
jgi:hypothetical protein